MGQSLESRCNEFPHLYFLQIPCGSLPAFNRMAADAHGSSSPGRRADGRGGLYLMFPNRKPARENGAKHTQK